MKTDIPENYRNTIAIEPPLSQYYRNIPIAYRNTIAVVKISPIVTPTMK